MTKLIFITGNPGAGKSRLVREVVEESDLQPGGIITPEVREGGRRVGFKILDLKTGNAGVLASVREKTGPRVGKYRVNLEDLKNIGVAAINKAVKDPKVELIVIDELGKMELCLPGFKEAVEQAFLSGKKMLVVVHRTLAEHYAPRGRLFTLTPENREEVKKEVLRIIRETHHSSPRKA